MTGDDSVLLSSLLKGKGVDLIDCSSGGNVPGAKIPVAPLYQVPFAEKLKRETGILTGAVGMINTAEEAEVFCKTGRRTLCFLPASFYGMLIFHCMLQKA